jgi:hypothetical protein
MAEEAEKPQYYSSDDEDDGHKTNGANKAAGTKQLVL